MTLVATQVKRRRGTTTENNAFTGAEGEITVDTTTHEIRVHDGSTVGGHTIPTKNYSYSKTESDDLLSNKANVALNNLTSAGKKMCANMAMPSDRYIDLTLGSSSSTYTAPTAGYFSIQKQATSSGQYLSICKTPGNSYGIKSTADNTYTLRCFLPVAKGTTVEITYNAGGATQEFRFIYANGAQ